VLGRRLRLPDGSNLLQQRVREHDERRVELRCLRHGVLGRSLVHEQRLRLPDGSNLLQQRVREHDDEHVELRRLRHDLRHGPNLLEWKLHGRHHHDRRHRLGSRQR
jgi:hypothetical protein